MNEKNESIECEILFTYYSEDYNHHYVVFKADDSNNVGAAIYVEGTNGSGTLESIENDEEWAMLEEVLNDWAENQTSQCGCGGDCSCNGSCDCEGCDNN